MTRSKSPEKINFEDLVNKYNNPLRSYTAHEVESPQEAKEEFEKLNLNFQLKSDTKIQEQALTHILELLKGKIQFYPGGDLKSFAPYIASNISDLRPALNRLASLVVAAEALVLEDDFTPSVEIIFPALLKQLVSNNQLTAHSCHLALLNIAKHCINGKVAKLFLKNSTSPIPANRQIAAECAHIITETWPSQMASHLSKEVAAAVSILLQDPVETIKEIAVSTTKITRNSDQSSKSAKLVSTLPFIPALNCKTNPKRQMTPVKTPPKASNKTNEPIQSATKTDNETASIQKSPRTNKEIRSKSPSTIQKSPSNIQKSPKLRSKSPSTEPKSVQKSSTSSIQKDSEKVSDFIHPSNTNQARSFKKYLDKIIENEQVSQLDQHKGTLVESVLFSIKEIPNFNEWENIVNTLFDNYDDIFLPRLLEIISLFGFQENVIDFADKKVGIQNLAQSISSEGKPRLSESFNFFVAVFKSNKYQIDITKSISSFLQNLIKLNSHNKNVEVIKKVVQSNPDSDIKTSLQNIIFDLSNNENGYGQWQEELDNLYLNFFKPNSNQYLRNSPEQTNTESSELSASSSSSNLTSKMEISPSSKLTTLFFNQNLPDLIIQGSEEQKIACISFITAAAQKLRSVSFRSSLKPIINSLLEAEKNLSNSSINDDENKPTCTWHKNAIKCISSMMNDMDSLSESLIMVGEQNEQITEILLESLYQFTIDAIPQKIFAIHKVLIKKLSTFLNNDSANIRHYTISIFTECRKKIPKEFLYQMKRNFTPAQVRLIELKAGRYKKK